MTTVLTVGNSSGSRSCTATCHDARKPACDCVCGGRYHGKGSDAVLDRVREDVEAGVFGETAAVESSRQLKTLERQDPERVRFHSRAVRLAISKREAARRTAERKAVSDFVVETKPTCPCGHALTTFDVAWEGYCGNCGRTIGYAIEDGAVRIDVEERA